MVLKLPSLALVATLALTLLSCALANERKTTLNTSDFTLRAQTENHANVNSRGYLLILPKDGAMITEDGGSQTTTYLCLEMQNNKSAVAFLLSAIAQYDKVVISWDDNQSAPWTNNAKLVTSVEVNQ